MTAVMEPPAQLPGGLDHLSVSSVRLFLQCPEKWRRRHITGEPEYRGSSAAVGSAIHRAEGGSYQHRITEGQLWSEARVADEFSDAFDVEIERGEILWEEDEKPGRVKDHGVAVVRHYHRHVAPTVQPTSVERKYELTFDGLLWRFVGYLDLETADGTVDDLKSRSVTRGIIGPNEAASDLQVTANLFARRAEGIPATGFRFHNLVRAPVGLLTPRHVIVTPAHRTGDELDAFHVLLMRVAAQIAWCAEYDTWTPAPPGAWWCADRFCGYWQTCSFGGAHRSVMFDPTPRHARRITDSQIVEAVERTVRRDGTTTAAKVAHHLGIPVREAAAKLAASPRVKSERPSKSGGRATKANPNPPRVRLPGPNVYRLRQRDTLERDLQASIDAVATP